MASCPADAQVYSVPSAAMAPTINAGDHVLVAPVSHSSTLKRGDVVIFRLPAGESAGFGITDLIKRIVGLPGERIEARDGVVYINGQALSAPP